MFQDLAEMVQDQGETINLLENNIGDTKDNTKETVSELKTSLANESPNI